LQQAAGDWFPGGFAAILKGWPVALRVDPSPGALVHRPSLENRGIEVKVALESIDFKVGLFHGRNLDAAATEKDRVVSERILLYLLESLAAVDLIWRKAYPNNPSVYTRGAVRYEREQGTEEWLTTPVLFARGAGDCEDLAMERVAELREKGIKARAWLVWTKMPDGGYTYHALTWRESIDRELPPGKQPSTPEVTARGDRVLLSIPTGATLWKNKLGAGFIEDPSRALGM
jgi:hypothetical protein